MLNQTAAKTALKIERAAIIIINHHCSNVRFRRESNPQLALRRRLLYPFNYGNSYTIHRLLSCRLTEAP